MSGRAIEVHPDLASGSSLRADRAHVREWRKVCGADGAHDQGCSPWPRGAFPGLDLPATRAPPGRAQGEEGRRPHPPAGGEHPRARAADASSAGVSQACLVVAVSRAPLMHALSFSRPRSSATQSCQGSSAPGRLAVVADHDRHRGRGVHAGRARSEDPEQAPVGFAATVVGDRDTIKGR
jgi:hypothetical protein